MSDLADSGRGRTVVIALYYYVPYSSGLTTTVRRYAEALVARGWRVVVHCAHHDRSTPARERINGVAVHRHRTWFAVGKGVVAPGMALSVVAARRSAHAVIPVLPLAESGLLALAIPRRKLLPFYVCDLRLGPGALERVAEWVAALGARLSVRRAPAHIVLSREYAAASRVVGGAVERAVPISPPVDTTRYSWRDPEPLLRRLGAAGRPVVGFVGRLVHEKGIPVLIRAMRRVRAEHPDAVLIIAGEGRTVAGGGLGDAIEAMAADDPGILFSGFLTHEDLLAFYSGCTVLALPSIDPLEAFGLVQIEAMLCGCPVVASDLPGVSIPVKSTGMGRLAAPGDPIALAEALIAVIGDREAHVQPRDRVASLFADETAYGALDDLLAGMGD